MFVALMVKGKTVAGFMLERPNERDHCEEREVNGRTNQKSVK
jgi:hypothetical protein